LSLPNATDSTTLLILFAKAALPGQVKTRLIVALGAQGACDLYEKMMRLQIERFQHFPQCDFVLHITPDKNSPYSNCLKQDYHLEIEQQQGNDLGERMYFSISETLKKYRKVVLFGADCPFIDEQVMQQAINSLESQPLVFVPAVDGGYMLIGARQIDPSIFENISWSTEKVMQQTRQKIKQLGWSYAELKPLADIDRPEDLSLLKNIH